MVEILWNATGEISDAVKILASNPHIAMKHAVKAKAYHATLADLFKKKDMVYTLKMRDLYRYFNNAAERCD